MLRRSQRSGNAFAAQLGCQLVQTMLKGAGMPTRPTTTNSASPKTSTRPADHECCEDPNAFAARLGPETSAQTTLSGCPGPPLTGSELPLLALLSSKVLLVACRPLVPASPTPLSLAKAFVGWPWIADDLWLTCSPPLRNIFKFSFRQNSFRVVSQTLSLQHYFYL
jgi:hypothetical protein